jgi:heme exporter protein A
MRLWTDRLACERGGRKVFADLTFSVSAGEALLVTGANGAGKTSLLRLLVGLLRPMSGLFGLEHGETDATVAEQAHYLGHQDALKPSLTVAENLTFWCRYLGHDADTAFALDRTGLSALAGLPSGFLSAGQRRRLSLARLIAVKRPVWLLDEPTTALDAAAQARLAELMREHLAGGGIILAATHGAIGLDGARELKLGAQPVPA